ncbi:MAG: hypothetical protein RI885_2080 [Actinomycetota bacterium]
MIDPVSASPDLFVARAREALEAQAAALASVGHRVEAVFASLPTASDDGWRGPARDAYAERLGGIRWIVGRGVDELGEALAETHRAVATLSTGFG